MTKVKPTTNRNQMLNLALAICCGKFATNFSIWQIRHQIQHSIGVHYFHPNAKIYHWHDLLALHWRCSYESQQSFSFSGTYATFKANLVVRFLSCSGGMNGYMFISDKPVLPKQIDSPIDGMQMIANNEVLYVNFVSIIDRFQLLSVSHKY